MNVRYIGSESGYQIFKTAMMGSVKVVNSAAGVQAEVYEISSIEALYAVPKTFKLPAFFYITTKDAAVNSRIREYPINGIIFPPVNAEAVTAKLRHISEAAPALSADEYDTVRIKILAKAENIPPLPALAQQLILLTRSDSATMADVTSKIKKDQGISSRVIKLVNSPFYGVRQEITSIDRATVLLGFNSVKNIAAAISMEQFYNKPFNMYKTTGSALWAHSYKTACIAQFIGKELGMDEDSLYMAGLLHDVGKTLMADFLVKEVSYVEEERQQLGMAHPEAGALILRKWSVSPAVAEAVKEHHNVTSKPMCRAVYYANKIDSEQDSAEDTIDEMALTMGIKNADAFKKKIIPFITEFNADI